jgi:4-oxalomesaconate tautomerase
MLTAIPCTLMRGGTSKGLYFHAQDLPDDRRCAIACCSRAMGSPDVRQIDGVGGAHPLTSKVAVIVASQRDDADVDYLFLQVVVDQAEVSDSPELRQHLAGIGPWAIENGSVASRGLDDARPHPYGEHGQHRGRVRADPGGAVEYEGDARIDGVPGTAAAIPLEFLDVAGSSCGSLLPTVRSSTRSMGLR